MIIHTAVSLVEVSVTKESQTLLRKRSVEIGMAREFKREQQMPRGCKFHSSYLSLVLVMDLKIALGRLNRSPMKSIKFLQAGHIGNSNYTRISQQQLELALRAFTIPMGASNTLKLKL